MPVNVLLCEGGSKSPDVRVLRSIVDGVYPPVELEPRGDKYGLHRWVETNRAIRTSSVVAAIRDRDFEGDYGTPTAEPIEWRRPAYLGIGWIGWTWERVEIENYLIDPEVVVKALPNRRIDMDFLWTILRHAADSLSYYTAARVALSFSRRQPARLENRWGTKHRSLDHPLPDARTEEDCRDGIRGCIADLEAEQMVAPQTVFDYYERVRMECLPGGVRYESYLSGFSGKDILCAIGDSLHTLGFTSPRQFREAVLVGIERATDPWTWLPEWEALRSRLAHPPVP